MNKELLGRIIQIIKEKPKQWNQGYFHSFVTAHAREVGILEANECETAHCIAGWAHMLHNVDNGFPKYRIPIEYTRITKELVDIYVGEKFTEYLGGFSAVNCNYLTKVITGDSQFFSIATFAMDALDLRVQQACWLFNPNRCLVSIEKFYESDGTYFEDWCDCDVCMDRIEEI